MAAGYSGTPLPRKLGIKEDFKIGLVDPPENFLDLILPLPPNAQVVGRLIKPLDLVICFVNSRPALLKQFSPLAAKLRSNGMIWIAWPKKNSGVETDLDFGQVQRIGLDAGLVDVKICAIDEIWSGLKFVYRLKDRKR
ncbi:MAG TPA: hypothetical protein VFD63_00095 [Pyrinomonadaceae bacterium]|nr:hypothetical protein [Pyrinomonadaceae bacterium]